MINYEAIRLLDHYFGQSPRFAADNSLSFATNAAVFSFLKSEYHKGDITQNLIFKWCFSSFYGMGIVSTEGKDAFFKKMEVLRNAHSRVDARALTEDLAKDMGKNYFSFVTKMLNLLDDESYPIFDRQVSIVFQKPFTPDETRLEHQVSIYEDIADTYKELRTHPVIEAFRNVFHCPEMGYMKVLDTIFWHLGGILEKEGEL